MQRLRAIALLSSAVVASLIGCVSGSEFHHGKTFWKSQAGHKFVIECSEDKLHEVKVIELDNGHMKGKGNFDGGPQIKVYYLGNEVDAIQDHAGRKLYWSNGWEWTRLSHRFTPSEQQLKNLGMEEHELSSFASYEGYMMVPTPKQVQLKVNSTYVMHDKFEARIKASVRRHEDGDVDRDIVAELGVELKKLAKENEAMLGPFYLCKDIYEGKLKREDAFDHKKFKGIKCLHLVEQEYTKMEEEHKALQIAYYALEDLYERWTPKFRTFEEREREL